MGDSSLESQVELTEIVNLPNLSSIKQNQPKQTSKQTSTTMGNQQGNMNRKKNTEKKKYQPPLPTTIGKRKNKNKSPDQVSKIPAITPHSQCKLRLLKQNRVKDYLLLEEEFIRNQERLKPHDEQDAEERTKVEEIRGRPMVVGNLEEVIDDNHAIVSTRGSEHYVSMLSFVDKDLIEPNCTVLLHHKVHAVIGVLTDDADPLVSCMKVEKAPQESYADVGGLEAQIQEIKEAVELPLTHPEYYEEMGIKAPKGVILYGPPGTGKTLLAKAVANQTSATFLRIVGSELIQKYLGDGPKLVRELFRVAEENSPPSSSWTKSTRSAPNDTTQTRAANEKSSEQCSNY